MLPRFPNFEKLHIGHKEHIEKITKSHKPYSDHNFTSLISWDTAENTHVSNLHGNLILRLDDYVTGEPVLTFLGTNKITETINSLLNHSIEKGYKVELGMIPDVVLEAQPDLYKIYQIEEDRNNFDYIYSIPELIEFKGNKFYPKKSKSRKFQKLYKSHYQELDIRKEENKNIVLSAFQKWQDTRGKNDKETETEFLAIKRLLIHTKQLDLVVIALYVEKKIAGISINEVLNSSYAMNLFEKADVTYIGIFPYLRSIACKVLSEKYKSGLLNFEQDLGMEGLRKSKLSYNPVAFLKKYKISYAK